MNAHETLALALAGPDNQPQALFDALANYTEALVGVRLFTLMTFDETTSESRRIYSNMPDAYPVLGTKPVNENHWTVEVLDGHRTFVANTIDAIADVFPDYPLIDSLGCQSVINVPIVIAGSVVGTINCLHEAGHYTPERVAASDALKLPGAVCFLLNASLSHNGAS